MLLFSCKLMFFTVHFSHSIVGSPSYTTRTRATTASPRVWRSPRPCRRSCLTLRWATRSALTDCPRSPRCARAVQLFSVDLGGVNSNTIVCKQTFIFSIKPITIRVENRRCSRCSVHCNAFLFATRHSRQKHPCATGHLPPADPARLRCLHLHRCASHSRRAPSLIGTRPSFRSWPQPCTPHWDARWR